MLCHSERIMNENNENRLPEETPSEQENIENKQPEETPSEQENIENKQPEENAPSEQESQETKAFNWEWSDNNENAGKEKSGKQARSLAIPSILSACSVILLLLFAASLMLGIFPINGKEVVFIGVSDGGATDPEADASPELIEDFLNSVVVVTGRTLTGTSTGTGVIISENGYIVTNHHVIEDADDIAVKLYGEDISVKASIVGFHADDDVAVLKIDRQGLRAASFADSDSVRYGEKVYAIGNPEGVEFAWSVTQGIVSCPLRELMIYDSEGILEKKMNVVQTDASVNHGNSGGPLINVRGEIVGIITLKRTDSAGMGFALPADGVAIDVAAIIETGNADNVNSGISLPRPLLGITGVGVQADTYYKNIITNGQSGIEAVTEEYAKANPSNTFYAAITGVYVSAVSSSSDASKHLKEGDTLTEINGTPVSNIYDVMDIINQYNGGDTVTVRYYRDGKYYTAQLKLRTN